MHMWHFTLPEYILSLYITRFYYVQEAQVNTGSAFAFILNIVTFM